MIRRKSLLTKIKITFSITMLLLSTGCYDHVEVDELVYVVSMGIDSGVNGNLRISLLFAIPISIGVGPEPGEVDKATTMITVEAPTIYGGVNIINTVIGKDVNFSHSKVIIISKELAEKGVGKFMNTFNKYREFRPNTFIGIARGTAEEFLKETKPVLEVNPAKYFELLMESYSITGFTTGSTLEEFYKTMECTCMESVAVLLDVNKIESSDEFEGLFKKTQINKSNEGSEGNHKAGEIPVIFDNKANGMGMAIFRADKMVGEMNGRETLCYLVVSNMLGHVLYSIPETDNEGIPDDGKFISLRLKRARKSTINVKMYGEVPVITVKIFLEGDILSIDGDKNYFEGEELKELEKYAGEYMRNELVNFLEKTRSEFKSDICGTGRTLKRTFLFWDEWLAFRWSDKYEKAEFEVSAKVSVRRTGMTIKQVPAANMKGE